MNARQARLLREAAGALGERGRATFASSRPSKKLVTQMGTQIHAGDNYRRVVEIVQAGLIGPVKRVHVWNSSKPVGGKKIGASRRRSSTSTSGSGRGPTEFFEADDEQVAGWNFAWPHFHWRWWWEFGGGTLADFGCHYIDLAVLALGPRLRPTSVTRDREEDLQRRQHRRPT